MIRGMKELFGYKILARDGEIGKMEDLYFDDQSWFVRYVLVNTGTWLVGRTVLIAAPALELPDRKDKELSLNLSKTQVEQSPDKDWQRPFSRQQELDLHRFYNWTPYWTAGAAGSFVPPLGLSAALEEAVPVEPHPDPETATHFGSMKEVLDYSVIAADGEIGGVDDFLAEEDEWRLRYLVIHTRKHLHTRRFLLPIEVVHEISWTNGAIRFDMTAESIQNGPQYEPGPLLDPELETTVREYYHEPATR